MVVKTVLRIDGFLGRNMPLVLLCAVALGVCFAETFAPFQSYLSQMLMVVTFANSLGGSFGALKETVRRPVPILTTFVVMHLVMPALVLAFGRAVFPGNPGFVSGLVLQFTLPVGVATLMWVGMSGGNMPLCLSTVLVDTLLAPFSIPLVLQLLLGTTVEMDPLSMMKDLLFMVGVPALLAMLIYEKDGGILAAKLKPRLQLPGKAMLLMIVVATGSKCADFFRSLNIWVLVVTATIAVLSVGGYTLGFHTAKALRLDFPSVLTLAVLIGFRNISAGIVLAQQYFSVDALLPVSITPLFQQLLLSLVIKGFWRTKDGRAYRAKLESESNV